MEKPFRIRDLFFDLDLYLAAATLAALICLTASGVVMRYFAGDPIKWMEEVQLWFAVWIVFLGASAVARKTGHIAIDAFVGLFPRRLRLASRAISNLVTMATVAFLGYYSCYLVKQMYESERVTNLLAIPFYVIYGVIPISCLLMAVASLANLLRELIGGGKAAA